MRAVATIGAPADGGHVLKNFGTSLEEIEKSGVAEVDLAGRTEAERSGSGRIDRFERVISIDGEVSEETRGKIAELPTNARSIARSKLWRRQRPS